MIIIGLVKGSTIGATSAEQNKIQHSKMTSLAIFEEKCTKKK